MKSILLLRGINVGGHRKLPMKELCTLLEAAGGLRPKTYIQSGNVVMEGRVDENTIAAAIEAHAGFRPRIMIFDQGAFSEIAAQTPFDEPDGKLLHIWFTTTPFNFDKGKAAKLIAPSERLEIGKRAIYLHAPNGIGRSKLAEKIEALSGVDCTARNMNTVRKLLQMLDQ